MRPMVASKRLENAINQWLAVRRFRRLDWSAATGPATPMGGAQTVMSLTFTYEEAVEPAELGQRYQVKVFLRPPSGAGRAPARPLTADIEEWQSFSKAKVVDQINVTLGSTVLEAWVLVRRRG